MRCFRAFAICALALGLSQAALAAQVGTTVVGGRTVILDDDNTWRYAEDAVPTACDRFQNIEICIKDLGWTPLEKVGSFQAIYTNGGEYFGLVREPFGTKAGVTAEALQGAIISNAATGSKVTAAQVPVLAASSDVPAVPGARSLTYAAKMSNVPIIYYNVFKVGESESVQLVFWGVGAALSPEFSTKINQALAKIKID